jgi:trimeric autotransporter adhesin
MGTRRAGVVDGLVRGVAAVALAVALAGAGSAAAAAAHRGARAAGPASLAAGIITTVAGGTGGPDPGTDVALENACDVSFASGHLYIADTASHWPDNSRWGGTVREMSPGSSLLTTPAGNHAYARFADDVPATRAYLGTCGATADHSGNLVISDYADNRIRVVAAKTGTFYGQPMKAGYIYTIAGNGTGGFSGDGGPALSAELDRPGQVTVDAAGNVLVVDNNRIRVVAETTGTFYGQAMTAGDIYAVAGDGSTAYGGDSVPATSAGLAPGGEAVDAAGNLLIADRGNNRIRVVANSAGTFYGQKMKAGYIYTVAGGGFNGLGDGGPATSAELNTPGGVTVDGSGNLVIADTGDSRIRVVAAAAGTFYGQKMKAGYIYTVAGNGTNDFSGDGGPATQAGLLSPQAVAVDSDGNLAITSGPNYRVRVVAARTGTFYGVSMKAGDIYTVAGNGVHGKLSGNRGPATGAELYYPGSAAPGPSGGTLIADTGNRLVRMVAGKTGTFYGVSMKAGDIYTVAGGGPSGSTGDGGPATRAYLEEPALVRSDLAGNLLIDDDGSIQVVANSTGTFYGQKMKAGYIYSVAQLGFSGLAVDAKGNLVFSVDPYHIAVLAARTGTFYGQKMTVGNVYSIAGTGLTGFSGDGGPATQAELNTPAGVGIDQAGNVVFADQRNERIRVIAAKTGTFYGQAMTAGDIYTIAGTGTAAFAGDGGPASSAEFSAPDAVAIDAAGNVVIADWDNNRIRVIAAKTGTFYGQAMTAGDVYTVAGDGRSFAWFTPDGARATDANLPRPADVTVTAGGDLLVPDSANQRIRMITG